MTIKDRPALLLIDLQKGLEDLAYYGGARNNPEAEMNAARILGFWREQALPVFHVKHNGTPPSPLCKGHTGNDFKDSARPVPGEPIIEKEVNSAFIGTNLKEQLENALVRKLVIVGLTTAHCVSSTARMAGNLGYDTYIISDATATFDILGPDGIKYAAPEVHDITLATLHQEFATILETEMLLSSLKG